MILQRLENYEQGEKELKKANKLYPLSFAYKDFWRYCSLKVNYGVEEDQ